MKKDKFPNSRKPSHRQVHGEFGISEGNIDWETTTTHTHTEYALNHICQWRSSPDTQVHHQRAGAGQGGVGCRIGA